jgi:GGDEF domain-containing protein
MYIGHYLNNAEDDEEAYFLMVDVDKFKTTNDKHDHGDTVLNSVGCALKRAGGEASLIAHLSGD